MMKSVLGTAAALVSLSLMACSAKSGTTGGGGGDATVSNPKSITREEVPEGRFKPADLEASLDSMVAALEEKASADDALAFGVVLKELTNFWHPVAVGADRAITELEVSGNVQGGLSQETALDDQIAQCTDLLDQGADGLAIAPQGEEIVEYMDQFSSADKPVVTIDSDQPDSMREIYIGTDNEQGGKKGGETLVELLDGETGRVIMLGTADWPDGITRTEAATAVIEAAGNEVVFLNSLWATDTEQAQIAEAIDSDGDPIVGMIGVFSNAYNLAQAAVDAGMDPMPKIVAFDAEPDTLTFLEDGVIQATHVQRQYYMGYMSVYVLHSLRTLGLKETKTLLGDNLLKGFHLDTGLDVIRSQDLDEYKSFNDALGI
jgi:ribose transport system substrate-binding protein